MGCSKKLLPLVTLSISISPVNKRSLSALFSKQHAGSFPSFTIISYINLIPCFFPSFEGDNFLLYNWVTTETFPGYLVEDVHHRVKIFHLMGSFLIFMCLIPKQCPFLLPQPPQAWCCRRLPSHSLLLQCGLALTMQLIWHLSHISVSIISLNPLFSLECLHMPDGNFLLAFDPSRPFCWFQLKLCLPFQ